MKKSSKTFMLLALTFLGLGRSVRAETSDTLTLSDCYRLAIKQSETLKLQDEKLVQFEQRVREGLGAVLPKLDLLYSEFWQDTSGLNPNAGGANNTQTLSERPEGKIQIRQPVFSGLREFHAHEGLKLQKKKEAFLLKRAYLLLYEDVANAFYLVLQLEKDVENTRHVLKLTQDRIKDLEGRVRLGKSRRSEVLSAESQLATLEGQEEILKGQISVAREVLSFLVGSDVQNKTLSDEIVLPQALDPLTNVAERASRRDDLQALLQDLETKKQSLKIARGALYPTVGLLGNYYLKRVGFQEPIDWDVMLSFDLPLFQGGSNMAEIRFTQSELREAELNYKLAKRNIESSVRQSYISLQTVLAQLTAFDSAFTKAQESYKLQVEEYRYGLVNNLEVLQALNTLQETKKNLDRSLVQTKLNFLQLRIASEDVPEAEQAAQNSGKVE